MKLLTTVAAASLLTGAAFAQTETQPYDQPADQPAEATEQFDDAQFGDTMGASAYVGQSAFSSDGENVGSVDEIIVAEDGSEKAIISVGEFLGIGGREVAVPATDLTPRAEGDGVTLAMSSAEIEAAPEHKSKDRDSGQDW